MPNYEHNKVYHGRTWPNRAKTVAAIINSSKYQHVIDYGAGTGDLKDYLVDKTYRPYDVYPFNESITYYDGQILPFPDIIESDTICACLGVLESIENLDDLFKNLWV